MRTYVICYKPHALFLRPFKGSEGIPGCGKIFKACFSLHFDIGTTNVRGPPIPSYHPNYACSFDETIAAQGERRRWVRGWTPLPTTRETGGERGWARGWMDAHSNHIGVRRINCLIFVTIPPQNSKTRWRTFAYAYAVFFCAQSGPSILLENCLKRPSVPRGSFLLTYKLSSLRFLPGLFRAGSPTNCPWVS